MENDNLNSLEKKVELLIKKYLDLKEENSILKQKINYRGEIDNPESDELNEFKSENEELREKNSKAVKRLKTLLEKLEIDAAGF
jgi:cell division septum initiation protein DivIVA